MSDFIRIFLLTSAVTIVGRILFWSLPFEFPAAGFGWRAGSGWYGYAHGFRKRFRDT